MNHQGTVIRPPSEADSILLQVTLGCSHHKCAFCGAYKDKRFAIKKDEIIDRDIAFARTYCRHQRRLFLCDGDALILPQEKLLSLLRKIRENLPWVTRVGSYANAKSLKRKSLAQLEELKALGLGILYMGLESGDPDTLARMRKANPPEDIILQGQKVRQAGIKLSVTVLLGLAGPERSDIHARATGEALTRIDPEQVGALSLMLIPGTPLHDDWREGRFQLLEPQELLAELKTMLQHTTLSKGLFLANHASNHLPLKLRLPRDKNAALEQIDLALKGEINLKPEWRRRL